MTTQEEVIHLILCTRRQRPREVTCLAKITQHQWAKLQCQSHVSFSDSSAPPLLHFSTYHPSGQGHSSRTRKEPGTTACCSIQTQTAARVLPQTCGQAFHILASTEHPEAICGPLLTSPMGLRDRTEPFLLTGPDELTVRGRLGSTVTS